MATYKVIQDIEAEDKLVGPLSLKQFIYACISALSGYIGYLCLAKGAAFMLVVFLPVCITAGFFAFPWGRDQPTEIWALAKIRYFLKPRRRIWDQSGVKELVNITAPKRVERMLTNNLTQTQLASRLNALANTLDSRGWAVKNVNLDIGTGDPAAMTNDSDRLVGPSAIPQDVSAVDITAGDDMLDERNNTRAYQLNEMMNTSTQNHRQKIVEQLKYAPPPVQGSTSQQLPTPAQYWYTNKPMDLPALPSTPNPSPFMNGVLPAAQAPAAPTSTVPVQPLIPAAAEPTPEEQALVDELRRQRERTQQAIHYDHMKVIQPLGAQSPQTVPPTSVPADIQTTPPVTPQPNPATIGLARRDDLTIATIADIANKQDEHPDEVVISLHNRSS